MTDEIIKNIHEAREALRHLFRIPIRELGLSQETLDVLIWGGVLTVGDCVEFYLRDANDRSVPPKVRIPMYEQIEPKMKDHGYWTYVMEEQSWRILRWNQHGLSLPKKVVMWNGKVQDLYEMLIEHLGLSEEDTVLLKQTGATSVGECLDYSSKHSDDFYYNTKKGSNDFIAFQRAAGGAGRVFVLIHEQIYEKIKVRGVWNHVKHPPPPLAEDLRQTMNQLVNTPIEALGISETALRILKWHGYTQVWNCVQWFIQEADGKAPPPRLHSVMRDEIAPKLKEQGLWDHVLNDEFQRVSRNPLLGFKRPLKKIVTWDGEDVDLYQVSVEVLGLPRQTLALLTHNGFSNIGRWLDFFIANQNRPLLHRDSFKTIGRWLDFFIANQNRPLLHRDSFKTEELAEHLRLVFDVLEPALKQKGYWRFVEHVDNP
jgi:hypothetical protein